MSPSPVVPEFERLGTPEHLDRALHVTTPKTWLALLALTFSLAAVVAWSILGEVATYIRAEGIILHRGGMVVDAVSSGSGRLERIGPAAGATVAKGEVVAEIVHAQTRQRHVGAVTLVEERRRTLRNREAEETQENALATRHVARQRQRLDELQRTGSELIRNTRARLAVDSEMWKKGLIGRSVVERGEQILEQARIGLFDVLRRRDELEVDDLRRRNELGSRVMEAEAQLTEAERRAGELAAVIDTWRLRAPVPGRIVEIKAQVGDTLEPGQPVLGIETGGDGLDVLFYVSAADGKRIEAGMPALVSPATARREEFGSMTGTVKSLSEFPASLDGMIVVLQNRDLARTFSHGGAPYPGRIELSLDPSTASGFAWTAPQAAEVIVRAGTLAAVEVEVSRQPPVALIVPWIKEGIGL